MKTAIICCSAYRGNTLTIAQALAGELSARLFTPTNGIGFDPDGYDLIGLGGGINFGQHPARLLDFTEGLSLTGKRVFIFSTRCRPFLGNYHRALKTLLNRKGAILTGEYSCRGFDRTGPWVMLDGYNKNRPDARDLFKARLFAANMRHKFRALSFVSASSAVTYSEGIAVREIDHQLIAGNIVRLNMSTCTGCGSCLRSCPMSVFASFVQEKTVLLPVTEQNCIQCSICEGHCPTGSLFINDSFLNGLRIALREMTGNQLQTAYRNAPANR